MKKKILLSILTTGCMVTCYAQSEPAVVLPKEKKYDHYVGVQLNNLIRQVINFNNNTVVLPVNPYLVTYSMNSRKSGWGIRVGAGYNYAAVTNSDGITETENKINNVQARLGIEKRFILTDRWSAGVGVDGLYDLKDDYTSSVVHSFDTVITITKNKFPSYGGGVMGWLRFNINPRISIGTEASFYYTTGKEKNSVEVTRKRTNNINTTQITESSPRNSAGTFGSPVVFFLAVKF